MSEALPLSALAALLFDAERAKAAAERSCETLRAQVLAAMEANIAAADGQGDKKASRAARKIDLPGVGSITYLESGSTSRLDQGAAVERIAALGARLRDLGEHNVDDAAPFKSVPRAAAVRVTPRI
jgi:hypothetical protein